jgi:hypothetical protein
MDLPFFRSFTTLLVIILTACGPTRELPVADDALPGSKIFRTNDGIVNVFPVQMSDRTECVVAMSHRCLALDCEFNLQP